MRRHILSRPFLTITLYLSFLFLSPSLLQAETTSCLWSVSSEDNTLYVLGSVHVLKEDNYPLHNNIYKAFNGSSRLVFEVNLDEMASPLTQLGSLTKGMYTDGQTLRDALTPSNFSLVRSKLEKHGYRMELFQLMKPWMLATTMTVLELKKLGFVTDQGVDQHLFQKAKAEGKIVEGLETVDYQLGLFDGLSPKTQEQFLLQTLEEIDIINQQTTTLIDSWTNGKIEGLEVMLENMQEYPEVYEALITRRNLNWLPHIESYLEKEEATMIVVGTLHLLGEEGLLAMLKAKGYIIKQL